MYRLKHTIESNEMSIATITYTTEVNGEMVTEEQTFKGTEAEVKAEMAAFEKSNMQMMLKLKKLLKR